MGLEARIRRWYYHAERQGLVLDSILIHPDDYWCNRDLLRFLPIRVIGLQNPRQASAALAIRGSDTLKSCGRFQCR